MDGDSFDQNLIEERDVMREMKPKRISRKEVKAIIGALWKKTEELVDAQVVRPKYGRYSFMWPMALTPIHFKTDPECNPPKPGVEAICIAYHNKRWYLDTHICGECYWSEERDDG